MGSPLSPLIAEIYMTKFEENAINTSPITPICWFRKVDDIFTMLKPEDDPDILLNHLNHQNSRIQFTKETEHDGALPFLDVYIRRTANSLETSVYRKPTHTNQYIHFESNHPANVKAGIIATLTRRALNICTPSHLQAELDTIRHSFTVLNGYPVDFVERVMKRTQMQFQQPRLPNIRPECPILVTLPFIGKTSHKIKRMFQTLGNVEVIFSKQKTLKDLLRATGVKGETPPHKGIVYQITCSCENTYIGETGRPLQARIKEHQHSVRTNNLKSALSEHIDSHPSHSINWENIITLNVNQNNVIKRKIMEAIQIRRHKPKLNRDKGAELPIAYNELITNY